MQCPFRIVLLLVFAVSAHAADIQVIPQGEGLTLKDLKRIERVLTKDFPTRILRKRSGGQGKAVVTRVVYFPLKQRSRHYVLAVSSGRWSDYASRFTIYRIYRDSIIRIYTSRSWQANYPSYTFDAVKTGKDHIILLKEGVEAKNRYALASVFTFGQSKLGTYVRDLTPKLAGLSVKVEFPFRPLYAMDIALLSLEKPALVASDGFISAARWSYDPRSRRFESDKPIAVTTSN